MTMLNYDFMQRALIIGVVVSLICSTIGLFLVLKRFSMVGDTLSHVALAGVATGMVLDIYPVYTAIAISIVASLGIEKLRREYEKYAEISLSIVLAAGIGVASILINLYEGKTSGIMGYLFGSISLVTNEDLYIVILLGLIIIASIVILYRSLFYTTFDEEHAKLSGLKVKSINIYFSILVALTVTVSMRIVGILLVSSLMVLPVATSLQLARSFKSALLLSNIFGLISVISGLITSFYLDLSPGGAIVMASLIILVIVMIAKNGLKIFNKRDVKI
ncbi:zinc ABC transporter permease protein AdcB [Gottschalkia purinilytica]|uniref:Zinc ABC transporter permease protein AdcB n=1 Tax=Gottschalkia purinilytica TaxID=1503 RepID=A0A0L0WDI2_GOTPU|nr:metal ABC transporter permease [Gottschalkia purinilytica]KNF09533.1 zinc ABC transporter permease protein AdcB [Gottschalkia purinilytica]